MTTVLDLITDALQDAGIVAQDQPVGASDAQKAFRLLNRMLDSDSTESLMVYNNVEEVFPFIGTQQVYTIGLTGADWTTTRPVKVTDAYVRDTNGNDTYVKLVYYEEYASLISKQTTSTIPLCAYYNATFPNGTFTFWPIPSNTTYRFVLWSWKLLTQFTSINQTVILPPGYEQYIESNLAVRACIGFSRPIPQEIAVWAAESKAQIKRINAQFPKLNNNWGNANLSTFPISPSVLSGYGS